MGVNEEQPPTSGSITLSTHPSAPAPFLPDAEALQHQATYALAPDRQDLQYTHPQEVFANKSFLEIHTNNRRRLFSSEECQHTTYGIQPSDLIRITTLLKIVRR